MAENQDDREKGGQQQNDDLDIEIEEIPEGAVDASGGDEEEGERRAKSGGEERDAESADADDESLSPEERKKREKRREERKLRKQRREEERAELEELRAEVRALKNGQTVAEQRSITSEYRQIEGALAEAKAQQQEAERLQQQAKDEKNWGAHAEALEAVLQAKDRVTRLTGMRNQYAEQIRRQRDQPAASPEIERRATTWRSKNRWYDPNASDEDSKIAAAVDNQLANEGYNPATDRFWKELDRRLAKRLPHRVKLGKEEAEDLDSDLDEEQSPTSGSGRERSASSGKKTYRISAARRASLIDEGILDRNGKVVDREALNKRVAYYQKYDREQQQRGS